MLHIPITLYLVRFVRRTLLILSVPNIGFVLEFGRFYETKLITNLLRRPASKTTFEMSFGKLAHNQLTSWIISIEHTVGRLKLLVLHLLSSLWL